MSDVYFIFSIEVSGFLGYYLMQLPVTAIVKLSCFLLVATVLCAELVHHCGSL